MPIGSTRGLFAFAVIAAFVGAATGLVAGSFRLLLSWTTQWRVSQIDLWHAHPFFGFVLIVAGCSAATAAAAWVVRRIEPHAEGSGIPRVEAVVEGRTEPGSFKILPVKYLGGLLSIGAGLALGREGPSVQMGGNIGIIAGTLTRRSRADLRVLVAAGAAAGLATAFNAPIAGGVFVLEELVKRFHPRITVATLMASAAAFATSHLLLGDIPDFQVPVFIQPSLSQIPAVLLLGLVAGIGGYYYNESIMAALRRADTSRWSVTARGAVIGALVGVIGWFGPDLVGSGDTLTQAALLGSTGTLLVVIGIFALRWVLGVVSYAALTPGGLFAPMLTVGASLGLIIGLTGQAIAPAYTPQPEALALIGMAAFFSASVRAPVTGLILATEMTGSTSLLPPMLGACAIAMSVPIVFGGKPIYDLLTDRAAVAAHLNVKEPAPD